MTSRIGNWLAIVAFRWRCRMCQAGSRTCRRSAGRTVVECGRTLRRSCRQILCSPGRPCRQSAGRLPADCYQGIKETALDFIFAKNSTEKHSVTEFDMYLRDQQIGHYLDLISKKYLCIPASSACSERVFSTAGNIVTQAFPSRGNLFLEHMFRFSFQRCAFS